MKMSGRLPQKQSGLDLLAVHMAGLDPEAHRARERLEDAIGPDLATLLVAALGGRSNRAPLARPLAAAAA